MADVKISELPLAATLDGTEAIPGVQDGTNVRITADQIAAFAADFSFPLLFSSSPSSLSICEVRSGIPNFAAAPYYLAGNGILNIIPTSGQYATYAFQRTAVGTTDANIVHVIGSAHDNASADLNSWGIYLQKIITPGAAATTSGPIVHLGAEMSYLNQGPAAVAGAVDPFTTSATGAHTTELLVLDNGTGGFGPSSNAIDAFLHFAYNGGQAQQGLIFDAQSIVANGGLSSAIQMASNYTIDWFSAAGNKAWRLYSAATAGASTFVLGDNLVTISNNANATNILALNSGLSATQETQIQFQDQGVGKFVFRKDSSNNLILQNQATSELIWSANGNTNEFILFQNFAQLGSSSGVITFIPQANSGTFNWNWPITAGTANYLLTSAGGGSSPMTWTNPASLSIALSQITGLGTGAAAALADNVGSAGAFVVNGGALGTPSSGTVTNLTGTASININGTVGATTPTTGAFTTINVQGGYSYSSGTAGVYPAVSNSSAISWNFTAGGGEVDFFNSFQPTAQSAGFSWYQQTGASAATLLATLDKTGAFTATAGIKATAYAIGSNQVIGARVTGWNAPTTGGGAVSRGTYDTGANLLTTAETLAALITDLRAHGLIGT